MAGETGEEAGYRAKQLVEQWNQVSLGFEILSGKTIPNDDEGKPLSIIRPDLLPQLDGDSRALTASMAKREPPEFPGVAFFKKLFRRKAKETSRSGSFLLLLSHFLAVLTLPLHLVELF